MIIDVEQIEGRLKLADLEREFRGVYGREAIERVARESLRGLARSATVPQFLPVMTERFTRERLRALAQMAGHIAKDAPEALFVCVHNAGRSQMAALLAAKLADGALAVRSAGSTPSDRINPLVVEAMAEIGLDMSAEFPKPLTDEVVQAADVVITMGCGDACPIYPGKRYEDWSVPDPAEATTLDEVRRIREALRTRVEALLGELGIDVRAAGSTPA